MEIYIEGNPEKFLEGKDQKKVLFMISHMIGDAATWAKQEYNRIKKLPKPEGTRGTDPWDFETFRESFKAQYGDVGVKERALKELSKLNHPASQKVPDYISKFRVLVAEAEIAEETLIVHYFQQGLHERIWEDIRRVHVPPPKTWKR